MAVEDKELFADALEKTADIDRGYLGSPDVIQSLLRMTIAKAVDLALRGQDVLGFTQALCKETADILLGGDKNYHSVIGWNQPGGIDVFCARCFGSLETDPKRRMEHAVLKMLEEIFSVARLAETAPEEEWMWQMDALTSRYTGIFLGVDPVSQIV